jgi:hypothetical protein
VLGEAVGLGRRVGASLAELAGDGDGVAGGDSEVEGEGASDAVSEGDSDATSVGGEESTTTPGATPVRALSDASEDGVAAIVAEGLSLEDADAETVGDALLVGVLDGEGDGDDDVLDADAETVGDALLVGVLDGEGDGDAVLDTDAETEGVALLDVDTDGVGDGIAAVSAARTSSRSHSGGRSPFVIDDAGDASAARAGCAESTTADTTTHAMTACAISRRRRGGAIVRTPEIRVDLGVCRPKKEG